jgi:hypothetical protein
LENISAEFRQAADLARGDILVLTKNGKPTFAIVGVSDQLALEALSLGRNAAFMTYLDQVSARGRRGEKHSMKDIHEEFGIEAATPTAKRGKRKSVLR